MTREEAIEALTSKNVNNSDMMLEALEMAIEALKQEPLTYVLDKIKAEVIARDRNVKTVRSDGRCLFTAEEVLEIIDKYRMEVLRLCLQKHKACGKKT